jgi:serine phosphatase RsbU (regulator of sigma subunit)
MRLRARFTLMMTASLAVVLGAAGAFLYKSADKVTRTAQEHSLRAAAELSAQAAEVESRALRVNTELTALRTLQRTLQAGELEKARVDVAERVRALEAERSTIAPFWTQVGSEAADLGGVLRAAVTYGPDGRPGTLYRVKRGEQESFSLVLPESATRPSERGLLGLIVGTVLLVILVGASVSILVAGQVAGPLEQIVEDIRHISTGDLQHRTRAKGGGELGTLARAIDRMTKNLAEARENELALSIRERELALAGEVREALLPQTTPGVPGYEIGAAHLSSSELWGDFHDFIEPDGRVGLLVCDVSGKGLPGALVGATARSYLRSALKGGGDVAAALREVNRELARDVKRGMYVSALYVLLDPRAGVAQLVCAGHKMPLVRFASADGKVRVVQPEGIALAFDKGPIFDRRLEVAQVPVEPGDRLVLVNTGAIEVTNAEGRELGDKPLFATIQKHAALPTAEFLGKLRTALENYAAGGTLARDVSIVTLRRT